MWNKQISNPWITYQSFVILLFYLYLHILIFLLISLLFSFIKKNYIFFILIILGIKYSADQQVGWPRRELHTGQEYCQKICNFLFWCYNLFILIAPSIPICTPPSPILLKHCSLFSSHFNSNRSINPAINQFWYFLSCHFSFLSFMCIFILAFNPFILKPQHAPRKPNKFIHLEKLNIASRIVK